jgi:predicted nucleic-acid-binding Zn-ribbon protein
MRDTHTCPKCSHGEVLFVPQVADRDDRDVIRPLVLHVVEFDWRADMEFGKLQAYVCRKCGFTEIYTSDPASIPLQKLPPGSKVLHAKDAKGKGK